MGLALRRRFFAEEVEAVGHLRTPGLVDALATVPREAFLPVGPWTVVSEGAMGAPRATPDADPARVYHCLAVAIDAERQIYNGGPVTLGVAIDALAPRPGEHVVHVGCGSGYYTALMAHCVGPRGRVTAIEIDSTLAAAAARNLADWPWVSVVQGDGRGIGRCDALLVNAGATHPLDEWLDALAPPGRLVLPLTVASPDGSPMGRGPLVHVAGAGGAWTARLLTFVAIYSARGLRDEGRAPALRAALARNPVPPLRALRREPHEEAATCWLHAPGACFSTLEPGSLA